jgi:hypothetical protein
MNEATIPKVVRDRMSSEEPWDAETWAEAFRLMREEAMRPPPRAVDPAVSRDSLRTWRVREEWGIE